ncbi:UDP-3-O-[3-hydroxymyristoyl] glucosamine N-acyltransferase, LpxD [Candidatus Omnitrophus magneticus]|uniref:UDP-3-O-acylglucosamine N-acyltransferase n=1 Tax=Candidatus Omnitrophus magneticus TaxID=1609969 RepID=A0A0F0CX16_9BACT|nr:UDP-3-O-[3-hydroxymyristoyl] glucosamine N-acyltransferase, LpxD [Candidatus Omnitrophus magneticus]
MKIKGRVKMISALEISKIVKGILFGDGSVIVKNISSSDTAREGDIVVVADIQSLEKAKTSAGICVMTNVSVEKYPKPLIVVNNIKEAATILYNFMLNLPSSFKGAIHPSSIIAKTAKIGQNVSIGAYVVIGENTIVGDNVIIKDGVILGDDVTIGEKTILYANVTIYDNMVIGKRVILHSGTVIGADGFGYVPKSDRIYKVPQLGRVVIEDDVEIGANSCVDKGAFTDTIIGKSSKIDNLVQIAHNVKLGKNVIIAANSGIGGSTVVGDNVMMGGMVGVADHVTIGSNVRIAGRTGVHTDIEGNKTYMGYPVKEAHETAKLFALFSILLKNSKKLRMFLKNLPE